MDTDTPLTLPFLNRDMLKFKDGATFTLRVTTKGTGIGTLSLAGITREGTFTYKPGMGAGGAALVTDYRIHDIPTFISVSDPTGYVQRPGAYVSVALVINGNIVEELMRGYVWSYKSITWPVALTEPPIGLETGGLDVAAPANPGAGNNLNYTRNDELLWKIKTIEMTLTTGAAVANRVVHLRLVDSIGGNWEVASTVNHAASLARVYHFMAGLQIPCYADDNDIFVPLPTGILMGGNLSEINTVITNLQAADALSDISVGIEKFITYT